MGLDFLNIIIHSLPFFRNIQAIGLLISGTFLGVIFGAIPGLTATMAMAIFLPLTFGMSETNGILLLIGIYVGACYGGSISAILINIPGTPSAIATGFDGYPMAQKGEAGRAIGISTISSALGGLFGILVLIFAAPILANLALKFSAHEYTGVALLGISIVSYISTGSTIKGLVGGIIGFLLACVGQDIISAYPRFHFGLKNLEGGLEIIPVMVGFFGITEVFIKLEKEERLQYVEKITKIIPKMREIVKMGKVILISSSIGTFIGAIPAAGGAIASMAAYGVQKRFSTKSTLYGTGIPEGIAAAESANNAAVGGAFIPLLSLGIPGDPQTAVLLGSLMIHGLAPGPLLFKMRPDFISIVYLGNILSIFFFSIMGLLGARFFAKLIKVPSHILLPTIFIFCIVGTYAIRNSIFDIYVLIGCGIAGYLLQKIGILPAPIILGFVLGPIIEENFRRGLIMSGGDWTMFLTRPISLILLMVNLFILIGPPILSRLRKIKFT